MKKKLLLILIFIIMIGFIGYYLVVSSKQYQLKKVGYDDYQLLVNKLDNEEINTVIKFKYNKELLNISSSTEYQKDKLYDYLNYSKNNSIVSGGEIVELVNNGIDKLNIPYNPLIIKLIKEKYYLSKNLTRYIEYSTKNTDLSTTEAITYVNSNRDYEYYTNSKDTDLSKEILVLTNKYYKLPSNYQPNDLVPLNSYGNWGSIRKEVYDAFVRLNNDVKKLGYKFRSSSPFRDYETQDILFNRYVNNNGLEYALNSSAKPGYSEHQTGLAIDINNGSSMNNFGNTKDSAWLKNNAHLYGFILRYPEGKENITGYKYEPWHYRYVGIKAATYIYENNLTFEEYYAYFVENN